MHELMGRTNMNFCTQSETCSWALHECNRQTRGLLVKSLPLTLAARYFPVLSPDVSSCRGPVLPMTHTGPDGTACMAVLTPRAQSVHQPRC
jgi:hypothetical protein